MRRITRMISFLMMAVLVLGVFTACSGSGGGEAQKKTYTWNDTKFEVKDITDDESVIGDNGKDFTGKCVAVTLDFGEAEISQTVFEQNVNNGKLLLKGQKPKNYSYHMSNMVLEGSGFVTQITGETTVFFDMDKDYEINRDDLEISE